MLFGLQFTFQNSRVALLVIQIGQRLRITVRHWREEMAPYVQGWESGGHRAPAGKKQAEGLGARPTQAQCC